MKNIGLKRKVMFGCIIFVVLLTVAVGVGGYVQYKNNITQKYRDYAGTVNDFADYIFEQNHMAELIRERSMEGGYEETRKSLNAIKERADIAYVFAVYFEDMSDPYSMCYVINGATGEELAEGGSEEEVYSYMGEKCGEDDFDEAMRKAFLESIASGEKGKVYYDNVTPEYGHMLTCYRVIYDGSTPVGILSVDEDVNQIQKNMRNYALQMIINAFIFMLIFDRHYIGIATFINLFLLGYIIQFTYEFLQTVIVDPAIWVRVLCLVVGVVIICFGSAFYMTADLGVSTYDAVALIIVNTWKKGRVPERLWKETFV